MRTQRPQIPVTAFERRLTHRHNLPGHWARTNHELRGGHR